MPMWLIFAALASIAVTAVLTLVLWRMNAPRDDAGPAHGDGVSHNYDSADSGGDGGGD